MKIQTPFPPMKALQWLRPLLRLLRIHKPGTSTFTLNEMSIIDTIEYLELIIEAIRKLTSLPTKPLTIDEIQQETDIGINIVQQNPRFFHLSTGIDDPVFFQALQPSEARKLQEAIEKANPALQEFRIRLSLINFLIFAENQKGKVHNG